MATAVGVSKSNAPSGKGAPVPVVKPEKAVKAVKAAAPVVEKPPKPAPLVGNVIHADLTKYHKDVVVKADGTKKATIDNGDEIGERLRGLDLDEVYGEAASELEVTVGELKAKYGHLNPGMQRMNLGNRIRGAEAARIAKSAKEAKAVEREALKAKVKAEKEAKAKELADKKADAAVVAAAKKAEQDRVAAERKAAAPVKSTAPASSKAQVAKDEADLAKSKAASKNAKLGK